MDRTHRWDRILSFWPITLLLVLVLPFKCPAVPQCDHYGGCRGAYQFVPAPPGRTPPCARPGDTYCEKLDHYPMDLIRYLIERWGYDYGTLLSDESRDEFSYTPPPPPPPPPQQSYGYSYQPGYSGYAPPPSYNNVPVYYPQQQVQQHHNNVSTGGYPDRHYRFVRSHKSSQPILTNPTTSENKSSEALRQRRQAANTQGQLCPTTSQFIMPKAALNNRGNWMYVVNLNEVDDRYTQLVKSERCASNQCSGLCSIPNGYTATCQQQYVQKRLIALEGSGDRLYTDVFWFPHCCVCTIQQTNG